MKIPAESPERGIPAVPVPWNVTTWQHTAERAEAVLSELLVPGVKVAASTVWEILHEAGIDSWAPPSTRTRPG
jgi:hypothetical protein